VDEAADGLHDPEALPELREEERAVQQHPDPGVGGAVEVGEPGDEGRLGATPEGEDEPGKD
jgi:hypothetical protein